MTSTTRRSCTPSTRSIRCGRTTMIFLARSKCWENNSAEWLRKRATKICGRFEHSERRGEICGKPSAISGVFHQRYSQFDRSNTAILLRPLQKNLEFSARFYCHHYKQHRLGFLREETWS